MTDFLDIEPDAAPVAAGTDLVALEAPAWLSLAGVLPPGFDLQALLTFLPDVRDKRALAALAAEAQALAVTGADGLTAADALRPRLKAQMREIADRFAYPCELAHTLHSRLTGLRKDFLLAGDEALDSLDRRMYAERTRLDAVAAEARRESQAVADREARERFARASAAAEQQQAPAPIVDALKAQARTATAPPVASPAPPPVLANTTTVPHWKARFRGADAAREPNPDVATLTAHELTQVRALLDGILRDRVPVAAIAVNWSYLNARAAKEKSALDIPGVEAYDAGQTRSKPKGRGR